jgi:hypothetical protein
MAKGSKDQTISSVSDIMGFLLEESRKPPEKRRPIKTEHGELQADSEYISTLVEALALPGTLVGDKYLDTIQSIVDPAVKIGTYKDRIGQVKMKLSDLPEFYDNPDEFIDKLFEKNKAISNKLQRIQWAGEQMRMVHGSAYARREKLFDSYPPEMKEVLIRAMGQTAQKSKQAYDQIWVRDASQKIFNGSRISDYRTQLDSLIRSETDPERRKELEKDRKKIEDALKGGKDLYPVEQFRGLLDVEFKLRGQEVLRNRRIEDLSTEEFEEYMKTIESRNLLGLWGQADGLKGRERLYSQQANDLNRDKRSLLKRKEAIISGGSIRLDGRVFDYSGISDADRKRFLKEINGKIRGKNKAISALRGDQITKLGTQMETLWFGLSGTFGDGGLSAILTGDFYDPKKGFFGCPSGEEEFLIGAKGDYRNIKFVKAEKRAFVVGSKGRDGLYQYRKKPMPLTNKYNELMVDLYYWNPITLVKTLVTGERFAWMADKNLEKISQEFQQDNLQFLAQPEFLSFLSKYQSATLEERSNLLESNENYRELIERFERLIQRNPRLLAKIQRAQEFAKKYEKLRKLAIVFSQPQSILNFIEQFGAEQTKAIRQFISTNILEKLFKEDAVKAMLKDWVDFGVGKTVVAGITKAITTWIVKLIGTASATVTGGISLIVSGLLSDLFEKISKATIKIIIYSITGVFGIFIVLGSLITFNNRAKTDGYSRVVAGDVYENPSFTSYGGGSGLGDESEYDNPNSGALAEFIPGNLPDGMTCLFSSGPSLRCTQGPYSSCNESGYHQPSHYNSPAIDVGTGGNFAAPQFCDVAQGNCKVVSVGQETCQGGSPAGGYVIFTAEYNGRVYQFFVLHVAIGVSSGEILGPGQAVATITHDESWRNCSTGLHAHVTVKVNGSYVNPRDVLNQDFGCSIGICPVENVCYW